MIGIPDKLVNTIGLIYREMQARVLTPDDKTEFFNKLEVV